MARVRGRRYRGKIGNKGQAIAMKRGRMSGSMFSMGRYMRYKNPTHFFKRVTNICNTANITVDGALTKLSDTISLTSSTTGSTAFGSYSVYGTLDCLPNYTEFSTLFDRYKIVGMSMKFLMFNTGALTGAAVSATYSQSGILWHGITDYDDATAPPATEAGIQQLREYESYKVKNALVANTIKQYCRPKLAVAAYGGAFTRYANMPALWVDANSTDVQHYGFKGIFEISPCAVSSNTIVSYIKPELTIYLQMKDLR